MSKHQAIIKGCVNRKLYRFGVKSWFKGEYEVYSMPMLFEEKELWSGEIDAPFLEKGERFYIEEKDIEVVITGRIRTTSGVIYETKYEIELVEDGVTANSKSKAESEEKLEKQRELERKAVTERKIREEKEKTSAPKKNNWLTRLFR